MASQSTDRLHLIEYLQNPGNQDEESRERLIEVCQDVIASLETPIETARKQAFLTLDHAVIRSAIKLNLFEVLNREDRPYSTQELALATTPQCNDVLLSRLLRYLATRALRLVTEISAGFWQRTARGSVFAQDGFKSGCSMYFDACGPAFQALPTWICTPDQERLYSPFQVAHPGQQSFFRMLQENDAMLQTFQYWMETVSRHQFCAQDTIDFNKWIPEGTSNSDVVFIDVGGGTGDQAISLCHKRVGLPGRMINQDLLPISLEAEKMLRSHNIQHSTYNFFDEQPFKGM
jgi:demethylsterigmatocystin 6-O-methyltransferase